MTEPIAYFENGTLIGVCPRDPTKSLYDDRGAAYKAKSIVIDGRAYDLMDAESVGRIPCPTSDWGCESTTLSLDYLLRMCASNIRNEGFNEQSILVLWKAVQHMPYSGIGWSENDYLRLAAWLYEDGRIEEGDKTRDYIRANKVMRENFDLVCIAKKRLQENSRYGAIVFHRFNGVCCEICAKYAGRVYRTSWSWKTRKYPKLPQFLAECGCWHYCCGVSTSPFFSEISNVVFFRGKIIREEEAQRRPFVDDRTEKEKQLYEQALSMVRYKSEWIDRVREYHLLRTRLPSGMMPKSSSAYSRMKNANTERYQAIKAEALKLGLIEDTELSPRKQRD